MNSRTGKSTVARCSLTTANTATATATNVAFPDFSYLTMLRKRDNIFPISYLSNLDKAHKARFFNEKARLFGEKARFSVEKGMFSC